MNQQQNVAYSNNYARTEEDERNDQLERAWKEAVTRSACEEFLRKYPHWSSHLIFKGK